MIALTNNDVWAITVGAIALAVLMVIFAIARSLRDKGVRTTRFGFYVERDRYGDAASEEPTKVFWPDREKEEQP